MIDERQLQEIRARADAASPAPWKPRVEGRDHESGSSFVMVGEGPDRREDIELCGASVADYDFIAHARNDVPLLLEEVGRLRELLRSGVGAPVLDSTTNRAVVKMPGRRFPGVVLQGDTLYGMRCAIAEATDLAKKGDSGSAAAELASVLERFDDLLAHYEQVLKRAGWELPYYKSE
jgi:hypothetical protein